MTVYVDEKRKTWWTGAGLDRRPWTSDARISEELGMMPAGEWRDCVSMPGVRTAEYREIPK